jgi:hypothetical protein
MELNDFVSALRGGWDSFNEAGRKATANRAEAQKYLESEGPAMQAHGRKMLEGDPQSIAEGFASPLIIAGAGAVNAPILSMLRARTALKKGADPEAVWQEHGAFKGYDKGTDPAAQMKWEIPDTNAKFKKDAITWNGDKFNDMFEGKLGDLVDHPEFFKNYPQANDWAVSALRNKDIKGGSGGILGGTNPQINALGRNDEELMKILLHEMQHGVQHIEKFGRGGNPEQFASKLTREAVEANPEKAAEIFDPKGPLWKGIAKKSEDQYKRLPGEVESRSVELRKNFPAEMLRQYSPRKTAEVMGYGPDQINVPKN